MRVEDGVRGGGMWGGGGLESGGGWGGGVERLKGVREGRVGEGERKGMWRRD